MLKIYTTVLLSTQKNDVTLAIAAREVKPFDVYDK
jgi:hypothetical protein